MPIERVKLLAYLIAEGGCCSQSLTFTNGEKVIRDDFTNTVKNSNFSTVGVANYCKSKNIMLTITGSILTEEKRQYGVGKNGEKCRRLNINPIKEWLKSLNLNKKSVDKILPKEVFEFSRKQLAVFLGILWSCDGSLYGNKFEHITFETGSPQLTEEVSHLLLRFGIVSRTWIHKVKCNDKLFNVGSLEVIGSCREKFLTEIGSYLIGEKAHRVDIALSLLKTQVQNTNVDTIPMVLVKHCLPLVQGDKINLKQIRQKCKFEINYNRDWNIYGPARTKVVEVAESIQNQNLCKLSQSDIFWDRVKSIKYTGVEDTYDLEVFPTSNFIANDIIVHNSRFLFNVGCNVAKAGKKVLYCTIEMDLNIIQQMWESREAKIPLDRILKQQLTPEDEKRYFKFLRDQSQIQHPFYIVDIPQGCTTGIIGAEVNTFIKMHGKPPDIVLVDYANLIQPVSKYKDRAEKYDHVFRELKEAARAQNTIYYTAAQMNRESLKAKKIGTEHVAFSDASTYHCDTIFHIHSDEKDEVNNEVHLDTVKGRYHRKGGVSLFWDRNTNLMQDWEDLVKRPVNGNTTAQRSTASSSSNGIADENAEY
jgi:replicative DNA helicase